MRNMKEVINEWYETIEGGTGEEFLDFAEGLNISGFCIEDGARVLYLADGLHYIADGAAIRETDGEKARAIIEELEAYGVEFIEGGAAT